LNISDWPAGWLREADFAELLVREDRALKVFDCFVSIEGGQLRICLAMEYATTVARGSSKSPC
jgi:hypothetical protein